MRLVQVKLSRSEHESTIIDIPSWEIPVLQMVHGPEKVEIMGEVDVPHRDYPDAVTEFDRLARRYKDDVKTEQFYVNMVYGQGSIGVDALERAIDLDRTKRAKAPKAKASVKTTEPTSVDI